MSDKLYEIFQTNIIIAFICIISSFAFDSGVFLPCGHPTFLSNGRVNLLDNNTRAVYHCHEEYTLIGNREKHCNNSKWIGDSPLCATEIGFKKPSCHCCFLYDSSCPIDRQASTLNDGDNSTIFTVKDCNEKVNNIVCIKLLKKYPIAAVQIISIRPYRPLSRVSIHIGNFSPPFDTYVKCNGQTKIDILDLHYGSRIIECDLPNYNNMVFIQSVVPINLAEVKIYAFDETDIKYCYSPEVSQGFYTEPLNTSYPVGSNVTYCDGGFVTYGSNVRTCTSNGTWSGDIPECKYVELRLSFDALEDKSGIFIGIGLGIGAFVVTTIIIIILVVFCQKTKVEKEFLSPAESEEKNSNSGYEVPIPSPSTISNVDLSDYATIEEIHAMEKRSEKSFVIHSQDLYNDSEPIYANSPADDQLDDNLYSLPRKHNSDFNVDTPDNISQTEMVNNITYESFDESFQSIN